MQAKIWKLIGTLGLFGSLCALAPAQETETPQDTGVESDSQRRDPSTRLTLRLRDRLLRDVVKNIRSRVGVNIVISEEIEDRVTIDLQDVDWRQALELVAEEAGCVVVDAGSGILKIEKPPRVYISFENADIQKVIDMIGKISGANIVVAPEVQGTITLRLRDIPWRDALEATCKTLGYVVVQEERDILRVVPASSLREDLETRHFQLRYVRPRSAYLPFLDSQYVQYTRQVQASSDAEDEFSLLQALRRALTPDVGELDYFEDQNLFIVRDTKPQVERIAKIIESIDVEPAQVFIDVKFVTTSNQDILEYGFNPGENGWTASLGLGQIPTSLPFDLGPGGWDDNLVANDGRVGPFADENLNPTGDTTVPNVIFGALDFTQVTSSLRLLKRDVNSEIVQAPKLICLDHQESTIFVGETIRYAAARAEQGQAGGLQLVVEEAPDSPVSTGFQLLVIPHIVPGTDKVMMDIIPKSEALSGTGSSALAPPGFDVFSVGAGQGEGTIALPRVASSTIATKVLLRSGQTAVLGGLVTDTNTETETSLPLLGDIPVLGWLFKGKNSSKSKQTLIVFVTPELIRSAEDVEDNLRKVLEERRDLMRSEYEAVFGADRQGD